MAVEPPGGCLSEEGDQDEHAIYVGDGRRTACCSDCWSKVRDASRVAVAVLIRGSGIDMPCVVE